MGLGLDYMCNFLGEKKHIWGSSQFSLLSLKPTNFLFYVWKMSKFPQSYTFIIKSNGIKIITNAIQKNNNAVLNFFSTLQWKTNNFLKGFVRFN